MRISITILALLLSLNSNAGIRTDVSYDQNIAGSSSYNNNGYNKNIEGSVYQYTINKKNTERSTRGITPTNTNMYSKEYNLTRHQLYVVATGFGLPRCFREAEVKYTLEYNNQNVTSHKTGVFSGDGANLHFDREYANTVNKNNKQNIAPNAFSLKSRCNNVKNIDVKPGYSIKLMLRANVVNRSGLKVGSINLNLANITNINIDKGYDGSDIYARAVVNNTDISNILKSIPQHFDKITEVNYKLTFENLPQIDQGSSIYLMKFGDSITKLTVTSSGWSLRDRETDFGNGYIKFNNKYPKALPTNELPKTIEGYMLCIKNSKKPCQRPFSNSTNIFLFSKVKLTTADNLEHEIETKVTKINNITKSFTKNNAYVINIKQDIKPNKDLRQIFIDFINKL